MRILMLGGTGAMGTVLTEILAGKKAEVYVTSRSSRRSAWENVHYLQGNAHNQTFFEDALKEKYDVVIDFMVYKTEEFENRVKKVLNFTGQYMFLSSSRVYADSPDPLTESSPRLLDVCRDEVYLQTDEYALTKARQENLLMESGCRNWTIIRPYITYNTERLQLGVLEKEMWLWRALKGRSILLPKDVAYHKTTMTFGGDVARAMSCLVENERAFGEVFHLTGTQSMTWHQVLDIYCKGIERATGLKPEIYMPENSNKLAEVLNNQYQIRYDRMYDRIFDNTKMLELCGNMEFTTMEEGLTKCLMDFIKSPRWKAHIVKLEVMIDRLTGDKTPLRELEGKKTRVKYLGYYFAPNAMELMKKIRK